MNPSGIILLSGRSAIQTSSTSAFSLSEGVRDKASSIILPDSVPPSMMGYEKREGILVRSEGLIATATEADIARYAR